MGGQRRLFPESVQLSERLKNTSGSGSRTLSFSPESCLCSMFLSLLSVPSGPCPGLRSVEGRNWESLLFQLQYESDQFNGQGLFLAREGTEYVRWLGGCWLARVGVGETVAAEGGGNCEPGNADAVQPII